MLLSIAAMAKGPQPLAYFALGVGSFMVARKQWSDLPGLALSLMLPVAAVTAWAWSVYQPGNLPVWLGYMRLNYRPEFTTYFAERVRFLSGLMVDLLPAVLLLPFVFRQWSQRLLNTEKSMLVELMLRYAGMASLALLFWPGAKTRYAMPAVPAVAVMAGLGFDRLWQRNRIAVQVATTVLIALIAYQLVFTWIVLPIYADRFSATRTDGRMIDQAIAEAPARVFNIEGPDTNQLFYVSHSIHALSLRDGVTVEPPAWLVTSPEKLAWIQSQNPGFIVSRLVRTTSGPKLIAARIESRRNP
jgi:hypothetical protein